MAKSAIMTVSDQSFTAKLARDRKRATDYRRKWQYGETTTRGAGDKVKPARYHPYDGHTPWDAETWREDGHPHRWDIDEAEVRARLNGYWPNHFHADFPDSHSVESEEGDAPLNAASANAAASDYFYSFDRPTGPSSGEHVLGAAVDQAVARFENKATETLVKNEYDVVNDAASEAGDAHERDGDFELV